MKHYAWYDQQKKPAWAPPAWLFGPVWTILYILIAISYIAVAYFAITGTIPWLVALPFVLNIVFNVIYTPIQFGLKNNPLALADVILVEGTLVWAMITIFAYAPWIMYINLPYLAWSTFAMVLQGTITWLNR